MVSIAVVLLRCRPCRSENRLLLTRVERLGPQIYLSLDLPLTFMLRLVLCRLSRHLFPP
jgi:hypothetical protein